MAQINRLRDAEIANGNIIDASDLDAELDQLVNESNSQDTRLGNIESGTVTLSGVKTFSNAPKMDAIGEKTVNNGVAVDGVVLKDSMVKPAVASPTLSEGFIAYDTTSKTYKGHNGTTGVTFLTSSGAWPTGYIQGPQIRYNSASQVVILAGLKCRDDANLVNIQFNSNETVDLAAATGTGNTNCLMNGLTENGSTWYYLWAIAKADGSAPKGLLTTSTMTITNFPTDYTVKRLIGVIRNDSSSNLIPFVVFGGWGTPNYQYQVFQAGGGQTPGPTNVLDGGTAASYTTIGLSAFVPPLSSLSVIRVLKATTVNPKVIWVRQNGASGDEYQLYTDGTRNEGEIIHMLTDTSQQIQYKTDGVVDISVWGFVLNNW